MTPERFRLVRLPEHCPTRTEEGILARRAGEIVDTVGEGAALAELGSGSSINTRLLIDAFLQRR